MSELNVGRPWFDRVNVKALGDDVRRKILDKVRDKLGYNKTVEVLDISKGALHNYLHGIRRIPDEVIQKALQYLTESEFREIVQGVELLKATGIVKESGAIDYSLAIGSAVKTASILNVDNRIMFTVGVAAQELGIIDADYVLGIPLSATSKNIYFDRVWPKPSR